MESGNSNTVIAYECQFVIDTDNKNATGFWNDMNQKQYDTLQLFKEGLLKDEILSDFKKFDDLYLLRFLRARNFDLEKTMKMFLAFLKWRMENQVDEIENFIFTEYLEIKNHYPHGYHQTDKLGRPIYIELTCQVNFSEVFTLTTEDRLIKYVIQDYEKLLKVRFPACSREKGSPVEQLFVILDIKNIGVTSLTGDVQRLLAIGTELDQKYYPEMLGMMCLVNTSFFFSAVWTLVQAFIDSKTRSKIKVLGSDYTSQLLEYVEKENLPSILGGTCTCSHVDGGCLCSDIGPWNPLIVNQTLE